MPAVIPEDLQYLDLRKYGREEMICLLHKAYQKVHKLACNKNLGLVLCKFKKC